VIGLVGTGISRLLAFCQSGFVDDEERGPYKGSNAGSISTITSSNALPRFYPSASCRPSWPGGNLPRID
jgi:hypothetical protein